VVLASELDAKRLSILLEAVPDRRRVAVLIAAWNGAIEAELRKAAAGLGVELLVFAVATPGDCPAAFAAMRARGAQALVISANPQFQQDVKRLAGLALEARLPTACEWADMAHAGCLIGYGPNRTVLRKRMATKLRRYFAASRPVIFRLSGRLHLNLA
jgi:putative ABC transport system substrate-binding protein